MSTKNCSILIENSLLDNCYSKHFNILHPQIKKKKKELVPIGDGEIGGS